MGMDIFDNIIGNFNGYALENLREGNPNPALDTTDFSDFFGGGLNPDEVIESRRSFRRQSNRKRSRARKSLITRQREPPSGFGAGF